MGGATGFDFICATRSVHQTRLEFLLLSLTMQWVGAPSCQRGSYAFYKSVSSSTPPDGPVQVWRLGEFYFIRCGPQDPVCVAEVGHMVNSCSDFFILSHCESQSKYRIACWTMFQALRFSQKSRTSSESSPSPSGDLTVGGPDKAPLAGQHQTVLSA